MSSLIGPKSGANDLQELRATLLQLTRATLRHTGHRSVGLVAQPKPQSAAVIVKAQAGLPSLAQPTPRDARSRGMQQKATREPRVLPCVLKLPAKPVDLEFPAALPEELWLDLKGVQHLPPQAKVPSDVLARRKAYAWRRSQLRVDILVLAESPISPIVEKLCSAVEEHYCPVALLSADKLTVEEDAKEVLTKPEVRLVLCTEGALESHGLLRRLVEQDRGGALTWHDKPIMVLPALAALESEPAVRAELWRKLAQWRRPV